MISSIHDGCAFCTDIRFHEEVLCDLNRSAQDLNHFECFAFRPLLRVVDKQGTEADDPYGRRKESLQRETVERFLSTDRMKYQKALALQKLRSDPDHVFLDIKYHFAWNVIHRRPVFSPRNDIAKFTYEVFSKSIELGGDFVSLLWLASDHIHLYVDSNGQSSVETMVEEIKRLSEEAILERFFHLAKRSETESKIWDTAYFSETIG
jgi:REP element-mobilizing transposase RayT